MDTLSVVVYADKKSTDWPGRQCTVSSQRSPDARPAERFFAILEKRREKSKIFYRSVNNKSRIGVVCFPLLTNAFAGMLQKANKKSKHTISLPKLLLH